MIEAAEVASQPLDYAVLATNVGIFLGFIVAAILGIKKGLETFKSKTDEGSKQDGARVAAATLLETQTLDFWSQSNTDMAETLRECTREIVELRRAIYKHAEDTKELRHQVERVRDRMNP